MVSHGGCGLGCNSTAGDGAVFATELIGLDSVENPRIQPQPTDYHKRLDLETLWRRLKWR